MLRKRIWSLIYRQWSVSGHPWAAALIIQTGFLAALAEGGIAGEAPGVEAGATVQVDKHRNVLVVVIEMTWK